MCETKDILSTISFVVRLDDLLRKFKTNPTIENKQMIVNCLAFELVDVIKRMPNKTNELIYDEIRRIDACYRHQVETHQLTCEINPNIFRILVNRINDTLSAFVFPDWYITTNI